MLSEFTVSNYKSFYERQTLLLKAGKIRYNSSRIYSKFGFRFLKFLAIYGANASGKSSLVDALGFAQEVIINGVPLGCGNDFCRVKDENRAKPSSFSFVVTFAEKQFEYGFEIVLSTGTIISEFLFEVSKSASKKIIFTRDTISGTYTLTPLKSLDAYNRLKIYIEDIIEDQTTLLLRQMNMNKGNLYTLYPELEIYRSLFNWFKYRLSINYPDNPVTNYPYLFEDVNTSKISAFLDCFGTGIEEFRVVDVPIEGITAKIPKEYFDHIIDRLAEQKQSFDKQTLDRIPAVMIRYNNLMFFIQFDGNEYSCRTIEFKHSYSNSVFSLDEESDGTIRLLDLIEILLCSEGDQVYVIDEINRRFHPLLTRKLIQAYLEMAPERDIQLIVTTHESELMSFDILRKDEIGFVSKDEKGLSRYYSMEEFDARFDKKVRAAYLNGDYGAIPIFKDSSNNDT